MKMFSLVGLFILLLLISCDGDNPTGTGGKPANPYQKEWTPWTVTHGGVPVDLPYLGGFNNPKPSLLDFNNDGLADLFIGQADGSLLFLQNTGTGSNPQWTPIQERLGGIDIGT